MMILSYNSILQYNQFQLKLILLFHNIFHLVIARMRLSFVILLLDRKYLLVRQLQQLDLILNMIQLDK